MRMPIIVVGAGGHGAVVADALLAAGERVIGFTDSDAGLHGSSACGLPVMGGDDVLNLHSRGELLLANGLGGVGVPSDQIRRLTQCRLESLGWRFTSVRHPASTVSPFATVANCAQLLAGSVVQAYAAIGKGCVVNTGAIVEHHAVLGDWVHVAPRALLCGDVAVGTCSHVGAGAVLKHGIKLGERMVVGAGAVVVDSFDVSAVLVGVPARMMEARR